MGLYADADDVDREFVGDVIQVTDTKVITADVDAWILEAEAFINSMVGKRYTVPVTGTESKLILMTITVLIVSERVGKKLDVKTVEDATDQRRQPLTRFEKALKMLEKIASGDLVLPDAEAVSADEGFTSFTAKEGLENTFKKGVDQW